MIRSILPFSLTRDKKYLIPNQELFGSKIEKKEYPKDKKTLNQIKKNNSQNNSLNDLDNLNYIKLEQCYETTFWRYQHNHSSCLATIEAAFYCLNEIKQKISGQCNIIIIIISQEIISNTIFSSLLYLHKIFIY